MITSRVIFFDHTGVLLDEASCQTTRSWQLNDFGQATITIPKTAPRLTEKLINFGNRVVIISDEVEIWAGVIYPPRRWSESDVIVSAYSGEFLLKFRGSPASGKKSLIGESVAIDIMRAQEEESLGISLGHIHYQEEFESGGLESRILLYDAIQNMAERYKYDWSVLPNFTESNNLSFLFNWYKVRGAFYPNVVLREGHNLESNITMEEQGPLYNQLKLWYHILYFGPPDAEWDERNVGRSNKSASKYGLIEFEGNSGMTIKFGPRLGPYTTAKLRQMAFGRKTFQLTVINKNNEFKSFSVGDVIMVNLNSMGFNEQGEFGYNGRVRVLGKSYSDMDGKMDLVVDSVENN